MPQGSDVHQKRVLEEKRQRWNSDNVEKKLDLILLRLDALEHRVVDLAASVAASKAPAKGGKKSGKTASTSSAKKP